MQKLGTEVEIRRKYNGTRGLLRVAIKDEEMERLCLKCSFI